MIRILCTGETPEGKEQHGFIRCFLNIHLWISDLLHPLQVDTTRIPHVGQGEVTQAGAPLECCSLWHPGCQRASGFVRLHGAGGSINQGVLKRESGIRVRNSLGTAWLSMSLSLVILTAFQTIPLPDACLSYEMPLHPSHRRRTRQPPSRHRVPSSCPITAGRCGRRTKRSQTSGRCVGWIATCHIIYVHANPILVISWDEGIPG